MMSFPFSLSSISGWTDGKLDIQQAPSSVLNMFAFLIFKSNKFQFKHRKAGKNNSFCMFFQLMTC